MDSEESRPGSSASSSSSNSFNNSRPSSPQADGENGNGPQSPPESPQLSTERKSRSRSRSSNENAIQRRSRSKSNSGSSGSSSSSDNENDDDATSQPKSKKSSVRSSSEEGSPRDEKRGGSRPQSPSPVDSQRSSRHTSLSSSNPSRSNSRGAERENPEAEVNISHEDLSDVSDMESEKRISSLNNSKHSMEDDEMDVGNNKDQAQKDLISNDLIADGGSQIQVTDLRQKLDKMKENKLSESGKDNSASNGGYIPAENGNGNSVTKTLEDLEKPHDEEVLDFEAEEGECIEVIKEDEKENQQEKANEKAEKKANEKSDGEAEDGEELEEGEVSDEDEKRPEETEPKPVCRFYTRGQCTWGMSCRFLHPGVTDKGNYTMFDLVRPVPVSHAAAPGAARSAAYAADYHDYRTERPALAHRPAAHYAPSSVYSAHADPRAIVPETPVVVESAWERGLRTAKEMMRKANKRKEQDTDFEDKKMNLPISPEELEKDAYYLKERASPPEVSVPPYGRHGMYHDVPSTMYSPPERFGRGPPIPPYDDIDPYGRSARYRELPPHRMPQYEDERRVRPTREVIVQRVEPAGRADEWNDPWMRSKSPGGRGGSHDRADRRRRDRRSYSSHSSYSSSTSSQSDSSSDSSRSPSPADKRRYNATQKSPLPARRHGAHSARSPISPGRRGRRSPVIRRSPFPKRRAYSPSPTIEKKLPYSPAHKRKKMSPIYKKTQDKSKSKRHHTSSSSGSDSSDSSASDSESDTGSSSSVSSSRSRGKTSRHAARTLSEKNLLDKKLSRKEPPKKRSPISIEIKKPATVGASALKSPTHSVSSEKDTKKSRREELLKQLRAVEDAIAKKRQKLS